MFGLIAFCSSFSVVYAETPFQPWGNPYVNAYSGSPYASLDSGFAFGQNRYQFLQMSVGGPLIYSQKRNLGVSVNFDSTYMLLQVPSESRNGHKPLRPLLNLAGSCEQRRCDVFWLPIGDADWRSRCLYERTLDESHDQRFIPVGFMKWSSLMG